LIIEKGTSASLSTSNGPFSHQFCPRPLIHISLLLHVYHPQLIICGNTNMGQTDHMGPGLLYALKKLSIHCLDLSALFSVSTKTPEEACAQVSLLCAYTIN